MDGNKARHRVPIGKPSSSYTIEQLNVVREILSKKDYYKILGLKRSCSTKDAHKAYRKLCLKVHPDKNNAPEAEDAFKLVSEAFQCLRDEENRKKYDRIGSKERVYVRKGGGGGGGGVNGKRGFDDFYHTMRGFGTGHVGFVFAVLTIYVMTTCVIIRFHNGPFYSSDFPPPRVYDLWMSDTYNYTSFTQKGMSFYVRLADFEQQHPPNSPEWVEIEKIVESYHHLQFFGRCKREMERFRDWGNMRESPECDALKRFEATLG